VPLTFFPIGRLVAPNADLVERAAREGHELENHTWDHQRLDLGHCPIANIPGEIERQLVALQTVLGPSYRQFFLRPPGGFGIFGSVNPLLVRAADQAGLRIAMWSVDSSGWRAGYRSDPAAIDFVLGNVAPGLAPGAIVLQHAIPDDMLALETEILVAKERGLRMATMAEGILGVPSPPELVAHPSPPELPQHNPGY
jgi:peptidoglycan/xylan/chitin deacetylase (PgdA/CDA1 family)